MSRKVVGGPILCVRRFSTAIAVRRLGLVVGRAVAPADMLVVIDRRVVVVDA